MAPSYYLHFFGAVDELSCPLQEGSISNSKTW
jgi:hypothetical protein